MRTVNIPVPQPLCKDVSHGLLPLHSVWYTQASVSWAGSKREPFQCCEQTSLPTGTYQIPK